MKTEFIEVDPDDPDPRAIDRAAAVIRAGGLVAFATETVYGLGADATDARAVARIFEAKGRPSTNPLIVHVADRAAAADCVSSWPDRAEALADRFWPGPLTIVLPRSAIIPDVVTAGLGTVGVRVPRPESARALIRAAARPIAAPSANRSNGVSPTTARHVLDDLDTRIDLVLDAGPTLVGIESTVLDLSRDRPRVLRPGEVTEAEIAEVLGESVDGPTPDRDGPAISPGQGDVHYAPRKPTYRIDRDRLATFSDPGSFALIVHGPEAVPDLPGASEVVRLVDPPSAARSLYASFRKCDRGRADFLLIVSPPDQPEWRAIRDRIGRASRPWPS